MASTQISCLTQSVFFQPKPCEPKISYPRKFREASARLKNGLFELVETFLDVILNRIYKVLYNKD
jgi:hypothetical protein